MSELLKIISIALVTVLAHILIKQTKPEIAILVAIVGSVILIISSINLLSSVVDSFYDIFKKTGIESSILTPLIKIIAIGYIAEFGANICVDAGVSSIGDKILFCAKIIILIIIMPMLTSTVNLIMELL